VESAISRPEADGTAELPGNSGAANALMGGLRAAAHGRPAGAINPERVIGFTFLIKLPLNLKGISIR
jgi:hypothetical protein